MKRIVRERPGMGVGAVHAGGEKHDGYIGRIDAAASVQSAQLDLEKTQISMDFRLPQASITE